MNRTWLVIDVPNLTSRARFTTGGLDKGVTFGFLKQIKTLIDEFSTNKIAFCFDSKCNKRVEIDPTYKQSRRNKYETASEEERLDYANYKTEVRDIRTNTLPSIGFENIFVQRGYEADDIVASITRNLPVGDSAIIVSTDRDLYQLLQHRVTIWNLNKKQIYTKKDLAREYFKLEPPQWVGVKAIAGCSTDGISGIKGVGDITAAKFLREEIKESSKLYQAIISKEGQEIWQRNLKLVTLPYPGTKKFTLIEDNVTQENWKRFAKENNMPYLLRSSY